MPPLPTGTVTLLFTDMEGSTPLLQQLGDETFSTLRDDFYRILRAACDAHGGREVEDTGDGVHVAFRSAADALHAATDVQRAMHDHPWPEGVEVRVRAGLHTGAPLVTQTRYVGIDVHRAARTCQAAWGGQILLTEETRRALAEGLPRGFSLRNLGPHRLKGLQRAEQLFQLIHDDLPSEFPPVRSLDSLPNNLPRQLTSFVGRGQEMATVQDLLRASRLVTLTGSGGCGKTRLALEVAGDVLDAHRGGAWLVELHPLTDGSLVPQEVASALGVREQQGRSLMATLIEYLRPQPLLLVLDNCEHLVQACAELANTLLRACPELRILATSRSPLRITGETQYRVPSLSLPEPDQAPSLDRAVEFEAIRLFVERAVAVAPAFRLTADSAPVVGHICRRLDGIPLAIELAAAWAKVLTPEQIAQRLHDRFRLLSRGSRAAMQRHQTLRATLDSSYELLSDTERTLFARLSVFAGSWALEAAETICSDGDIDRGDVLDVLTSLVDNSLVVVDESHGAGRFRMLETIRRYGRDRLLEVRQEDEFRRRHRDWHLSLAEKAAAELRGPDQAEWIERLDVDHDDIRTALEWCLAQSGEIEAGMRLAAAMARFWWIRGHFTEAKRIYGNVLAKGAEVRGTRRAGILIEAGRLAWAQSDWAAAKAYFDQALAIYRDLEDPAGSAEALNMLGLAAWAQSEYATAQAYYEEALAHARRVENRRLVGVLLHNLALVARAQGDYARARSLHEESLAIYRKLQDEFNVALSLYNLGLVDAALGAYTSAAGHVEESLRMRRKMGNKQGIAYALNTLAFISLQVGDLDIAQAHCEESLALARALGDAEAIGNALLNLARVAEVKSESAHAWDLGMECLKERRSLKDRRGMCECLEFLAGVSVARGDAVSAVDMLRAAERFRASIGATATLAERDAFARNLVAASAQLGTERLAALGATVRDPEQVVENALHAWQRTQSKGAARTS